MALQITTLTKISDFSEFIINYRGHASFVITTAGISTYVRIFTRKESMDRLIMLEVGKLRARVSGCLCLVMEGDCRGWGGEMHLCVVPGLRYLPPGAVSTSQQAAWPVQHPITDHSSRRAHTSHSRDMKLILNIRENCYKYHACVRCRGDPPPPLLQDDICFCWLLTSGKISSRLSL